MYPPVLLLDPGNFTPIHDIKLAQALLERGWDVTWVTSPHQFDEIPVMPSLQVQKAFWAHLRHVPMNGRGLSKRIPVPLRKVTKALSYPFDLDDFHHHLKLRKPGIIHVQWALLPFLDQLFWWKWQKAGWIVVFTVHDPRPLAGSLPRVLAQGVSKLCRKADAVIVHGQYARRELAHLAMAEEKLHIIAPGAPFMGPPADRGHARRALGLDPNTPVALFFGYIKPYKGLHILLESLPLIRKALGKMTLLVAGELMEARHRYEKIISRKGLSGEVRWHDGYIPDRFISLYFAAADVVVLPYLEASSSGVLLTSYACSRPVVASALGGIPEQVEDGKSGCLVAPGDPAALASALIRLLGNPLLAESMGVSGRWLLEKKFAWKDVAASTEALYQGLWRKRKWGEG